MSMLYWKLNPNLHQEMSISIFYTRYLTVVKTWARQAAARSRQYLAEKHVHAKKFSIQQSTFYTKADIGINIFCSKIPMLNMKLERLPKITREEILHSFIQTNMQEFFFKYSFPSLFSDIKSLSLDPIQQEACIRI